MIFGCGLSRTGNKSLGNALKILGYNPIKYPKSIDDLGTVYDAAVDITVIAWLDELEARFPEAKWILTVRDIEAWLKSCEQWFGRSLEDCSPDKQSYLRHYRRIVYGAEVFEPELWREVYYQHLDRINTRFTGREDQLLVINICQGESWDKLCNFLDKPIKNEPFPSIS
ncbi:MAG TPA: hypothetical protein DDZ80_07210 [Cyanobacteria bacterium UBA8803]|nr:hypothetical protein [Cyanobacteria bacterium UBA8803]